MEIKLSFDGSVRDDLDWDDVDILESGQIGKSKNIIARYVTDENNEPIPYAEALKILGKIKLPKIEGYMTEFLKLMKEGAINPTNAAKS